jgi:hypothetical protein
MAEDLIVHIRELLVLQGKLIGALRHAVPKECPKSGELHLEDASWSFQKYGAGVAFTNSKGVLVDVHRGTGTPKYSMRGACCCIWSLLLRRSRFRRSNPNWRPDSKTSANRGRSVEPMQKDTRLSSQVVC